MHEFRAGSLLLQKALSGVPGVTVQVYDGGWPSKMVDGAAVDDSAALDGADAVLIYADGGRGNPAIQGDHIKVLDALAAKGVGLGFAHYGVEVPVGEPGEAMHRWIGGFYEDRYSVNPMWAPPFSKLPTHPITRGVGPFATHDEWYFNMRWSDRSRRSRSGSRRSWSPRPSDEVRKGPYVSPKGPYDHIVAASGQAETMMWTFDAAGRRPRPRLHRRAHPRALGRRQPAADLPERAAVAGQGGRAGEGGRGQDHRRGPDPEPRRRRARPARRRKLGRQTLPPAEQLQRHAEADHQPRDQRCRVGGPAARGWPPAACARGARRSRAVSGSALMNGCTTSGKALRREEHARQNPHRDLHQVHQARHRLDGPGPAARSAGRAR